MGGLRSILLPAITIDGHGSQSIDNMYRLVYPAKFPNALPPTKIYRYLDTFCSLL